MFVGHSPLPVDFVVVRDPADGDLAFRFSTSLLCPPLFPIRTSEGYVVNSQILVLHFVFAGSSVLWAHRGLSISFTANLRVYRVVLGAKDSYDALYGAL